MSLIKKPTELVIPSTVKMMVYGQAGMGKSTMALSAPKPLLLDFDNGVKRINMSHLDGVDVVPVEAWSQIQQLLQYEYADLVPYETIVVDTIGKMMDFIILGCCGGRQPQIKDWGRINQEFTWFTRALSALNKHIVFVAHRDTRKEGDETVFIPALREKSYNSIVTELDLLGYLEMRNEHGKQRRTITFDPTSRNDGKNTCNLPGIMEIPSIVDAKGNAVGKNNFIAESVIKPYAAMLKVKDDERKRFEAVVAKISEDIAKISDAEAANEFVKHLNDYEHIGSSVARAREMFSARVSELGLIYDKESKTYADAAA